MHKYNRQQGGTILGIIIGLIIGLGIALGVAMVITKTPMPFTDKSGRQKMTEPNAGQAADPNKPLYGVKAAKKPVEEAKEPPPNTAAPQPAEKKQEAKVDSKLDAKADKKADGKAPVVEQSTAADKPKKAEAEGKADPKPETKAENADDKWSYYLQAGAFREQTDAENIRAKLALLGVEAKISERQADTGVLYRVRVGPFNQLEAMNKVRGKLSDNGVDAAIVRIAK
ncbi:SPOR domain-containing protein [Noviherbaspirillum saxi]|uniref:SPOR domain-containing protein n=1 Tax=Noviherbaspirillum saxi TaxID=2320863 RepID=A0A3A3FNV8_9BURK|nr:SPOR domain-containing protein [Noviherbaspirillum saxi]RJF97140.1 SPOR domain-containing protein [Noviherbaspirillum saxi]